jgi:hypothetical protein
MAVESFVGPWPFFFFSFLILHTVGRTPYTGHQPYTGQHKQTNAHNTNIHFLSGIRTQGPSVLASEDTSCLRPRGHCDRQSSVMDSTKFPAFCVSRRLIVSSPWAKLIPFHTQPPYFLQYCHVFLVGVTNNNGFWIRWTLTSRNYK